MSFRILLFERQSPAPSRQHQTADIVPMEPDLAEVTTRASAAPANIVDLRVYPRVFRADFGIDTLTILWFRASRAGSYP
jgi:hypothetical protein